MNSPSAFRTGTLPAGLRRMKSGILFSQYFSSTSSTSIFFSASAQADLAAERGQRGRGTGGPSADPSDDLRCLPFNACEARRGSMACSTPRKQARAAIRADRGRPVQDRWAARLAHERRTAWHAERVLGPGSIAASRAACTADLGLAGTGAEISAAPPPRPQTHLRRTRRRSDTLRGCAAWSRPVPPAVSDSPPAPFSAKTAPARDRRLHHLLAQSRGPARSTIGHRQPDRSHVEPPVIAEIRIFSGNHAADHRGRDIL